MIFCGGKEKRIRKRRKIFAEGKYLILWRKRKIKRENEENI